MDKPTLSPQAQTSLLLLFILAGLYLISNLLLSVLLTLILEPGELTELSIQNPKVGLSLFVCSQIGMFLMAFVVFLKVVNVKFKDAVDYKKFKFKFLLYVILGFVPLIFVIQGLSMLNYWIVEQFPSSGILESKLEHEAEYAGLFSMEHSSYFALFILICAILPAFVEELIFRGLLMKKLEIVSDGKIHFAVWTSAAIFAGIHLQPWNLIPMIAMGAIFGYIYHYTKDIRYSIILHAMFNSLSIAAMVYYPDMAF